MRLAALAIVLDSSAAAAYIVARISQCAALITRHSGLRAHTHIHPARPRIISLGAHSLEVLALCVIAFLMTRIIISFLRNFPFQPQSAAARVLCALATPYKRVHFTYLITELGIPIYTSLLPNAQFERIAYNGSNYSSQAVGQAF
jgi:hypothetical protein